MIEIQESEAFRKLREVQRTFWAGQSALLLERVSDARLCMKAMAAVEADAMLNRPVGFRRPLEQILADAAQTVDQEEQEGKQKRAILTEFSRKGGRAKKADVLQRFIEAIVARKPNIKEPDLLQELKSEEYSAEISVVDDPEIEKDPKEISFVNNRRQKYVPLSALKDRLCRARKKMKQHSR
jgi:hypothetical protein